MIEICILIVLVGVFCVGYVAGLDQEQSKSLKICKNCCFYHKNIKQCRLCRSTKFPDIGISVDKNDSCENFVNKKRTL